MSFGYGFSLPGWYTTSGGFSPAQLFTGGVQGAWYDPSDLTTLFQDSAGTTPVTAVEQAVGLMLDKSKGLVLGSELVTNGDFSQGTTGWSGAAWTISGSQASATAGTGLLSNTATMVAGRWYAVSFTLVSRSAGTVSYPYSGDGGMYVVAPTAPGTYTAILRCTGPGNIGVYAAGFTGVIDNVSAKELPGNHAYQTTSASRPTLRARYNLLTYSEEFENAVWSKTNLNTTGTPAWVNVAVAPDGTTTADKIIENTAVVVEHFVINANVTIPVANAVYTTSVYVKAAERDRLQIRAYSFGGPVAQANFNLNTLQFSSITAGTWAYQNAGGGWYRISVTVTHINVSGNGIGVFLLDASGALSYTGDGTSGIYIWGAQLTQTAVFPSNTYQRIGAATDYATGAAFPPYLFFDGIDDSMLTNSVDFATVTSDGQARRNLLSNPNLFNVAGFGVGQWDNNSGGTILTANVAVAPDGTTTASLLEDNPSSGNSSWFIQTFTGTAGTTYTFSCYIKAAGGTTIQLWIYDNVGGGTKTSVTATGSWQRFTHTHTLPVGTTLARAGFDVAPVGGVYIWCAQLETGSSATAFQNIGTDKMLVVAGVTKQSDAAFGCITELTANGYTTAGGFYSIAAGGAGVPGAFYGSALNGSTGYAADFQTFTAPITNVITQQMDIAQPTGATELTLRVNGVSATRGTTAGTTAGTGNFANAPLYIGRRNNASIPFNGNLYSLIIAGQSYSSGQISSTESWVAAKTPLGTI